MSSVNESTTNAMQQLAAEDLSIRDAMKAPPPNSVHAANQNPELDNVGLNLFRPHMTENGFNTFISILHWAILQQNISDGKPITYTDETFSAMAATNVGFGNPHMWEATYADNVGKHLHLFHFNWFSKGPKYRADNPLPHKVIRELAGLFSITGKGWKHAQMIQDLVEDPETYKYL